MVRKYLSVIDVDFFDRTYEEFRNNVCIGSHASRLIAMRPPGQCIGFTVVFDDFIKSCELLFKVRDFGI